MSAMILDAVKVNSLVIPNLAKTKTNLEESYKISNTLLNKLPSSASSRNRLSEITKRINTAGKNINTITIKLDNKLEKAKTIEKKNKAKTTAISAAVGAVAGAAGAAIGVATGGIKGAVVGGAIGAAAGVAVAKSNVISSVGKALKNTGAKIAKNVGNFFKSIGNGLKKIGKSIVNACKKIANKVVSFVKEKIAPVLKKIVNVAWEGLKFLGRCGATIVNLAISLVEGIVSFVEAIGDVVLLVVGGACSIVTALADIVRGVCTGEWDWKCTSAVWKKWVMPWVGYDWTSKWAFSWASNTFIDKYSFSWAKRDGGLGYKIGKGVGYVVGIALATIATAGIAGAATGAGSAAAGAASSAASTAAGTVAAKTAGSIGVKVATTLANKTITSTILAGVGKMGKATASGYNEVVDSQVKAHYLEQLRLQNPSLSDAELKDLYKAYDEAGMFTDKAAVRKSAMDNITGGKIAGVIASGAAQGTIEAATWYVTYGGGGSNILAKNSKLGAKFKSVDKLGQLLTNKKSLIKGGKYLSDGAAEVIKKILPSVSVASFTKAGVQVAKEYGNELATTMYDGDMNWEKAGTNAIVSGATSFIYDNSFGSWFGTLAEKGAKASAAREEAAKAAKEVFEDLGESIDDNLATNANQQVSSSFKETLQEKLDDVLIALNPVVKYAGKDADGKKIVGGGIKSLYKEGEKPIVERLVEKLAGGQ